MMTIRNDETVPALYDVTSSRDLPELGHFLAFYKLSTFHSHSFDILEDTAQRNPHPVPEPKPHSLNRAKKRERLKISSYCL